MKKLKVRAGNVAVAASLPGWADEDWQHDGAYRGCLRAGRHGFWLARWLQARGMVAYAIHSTSIAISRENRRAENDWLDTELLKSAFYWLAARRAGPLPHGSDPTLEQEDAKRPIREHGNRGWRARTLV